MHLFALLIAASFATQFVAPSDNDAVTITPLKIWSARTIIDSLTLTPATKPSAQADLFYKLTVGDKTITGTATYATTTTWTDTMVDLTALGDLTGKTSIAVTTSLVEEPWADADTGSITIESPALSATESPYEFGDIPEGADWEIEVAIPGAVLNADYSFVVTSDIDIDDETEGIEVSVKTYAAAKAKVTIPQADVTTLALKVGSKFYIFADAGADAGATAITKAPATVLIAPNPFVLTLDPLHLTTVHKSIPKLTITTDDNAGWPDDPRIRLTHAGAVGKYVIKDFAEVTGPQTKQYEATNILLENILPLTAANPVAVEISLDGGDTWQTGTTAKTLAVKAPAFTVAKTSYKVAERTAWDGKIQVTHSTVKGAAITVVVTPNLGLTAAGPTEVTLTGSTDATGKIEVTVTPLTNIPTAAGGVFYVFAASGDAAAALAVAPVAIYIVNTYTFTPVPANILYFDTALPSLKITPVPTTDLPETLGFVITKAGGSTEVTGTIEKDTSGGAFWITSGAVDLTPLGDLTGASPLTAKFTTDGGYSWLVDTATITVAQPLFSVEPEEVQFDEIADFTSIELTFVDTTIVTKIKVVLTKTLGGGTAAQKVELETAAIAAEGVATLAFTSTDIAKLSLAANDILLVYASPTSYDDALTKAPAPIAIKPAPTTFTFGTTTVVWAKTLTIPAITDVTPTPAAAWNGLVAASKLKCKYTVKTADSNTPIDEFVVAMTASSAAGKFTIPATVISGFELENGAHTIVVEISENGGTSYLAHKKEISITKKPLGTAEFTATPESIEPTATKATIEVTKKPTSQGTWAADVYFFFSTDPFEEDPDDLTKMQKATEVTAGSKYSCEYTLPTVEPKLKKGDTLYVYVKHTVTTPGDSNTPTWLPVPVGIPIGTTEPPKADFTVTPDKIDLKKTKGEVELKVTETVATGGAAAWAAEVHVVVSQKKLTAAPTLSADTKATADAKDYKIKYDVSKADPALKKDDVLYVYVSHTVSGTPPVGTWLEVPAEITISAAGRAAPFFSLLAVVLFCLVKLF